MNFTKKLPLFLITVNVIFSAGVSWIASRSLANQDQQGSMGQWLINATQFLAKDLHSENSQNTSHGSMLASLSEAKKKQAYLVQNDFLMAFEIKNQKISPILGDVKNFPYS